MSDMLGCHGYTDDHTSVHAPMVRQLNFQLV